MCQNVTEVQSESPLIKNSQINSSPVNLVLMIHSANISRRYYNFVLYHQPGTMGLGLCQNLGLLVGGLKVQYEGSLPYLYINDMAAAAVSGHVGAL